MEYIEYNDKLSDSTLREYHILINNSSIANGVKIGINVCITGSSIGKDCIINSNSIIHNSNVGDDSEISFSQISDSIIGSNCKIGPFAHIRDNSRLGNNIRVGNFVEIKKSIVGDGSKMAHLSYIGDAVIGSECNIGCGVVFCNYNGQIKQTTTLGDRVFIGSNANLIAPINIDDNAYIAAGSTINRDIGKGEFAIARERQTIKKNFKNPYTSCKK